MKKLFFLLSLLCLMLNTAYAQIDPSIPIPPDLQALKSDIKILKTEKLPDGTIAIRYMNKQGRIIQRRTHPSKPNEKQEWDEANPPQRHDTDPNAGIGIGAVPIGPSGARAGGALPGGTPGGIPPDNLKPDKPTSVLDDIRKGAEGILPDNSTPGKPTSALGEAAKVAEDILKGISNLLVVNTAGTGQTIGVIANITLTNNNDFPVEIQPQTFYIPSDGQYQSYVGSIPKGITIPPDSTVNVPVNGVCADVHTPPVPTGVAMPPASTWVPVDVSPPPGASDPPSTDPVPVNPPGGITSPVDVSPPPGAGDPPSADPVPVNPPGGSTTPNVVTMIPVVNTVPVPKFNPTDIPHITTTPGFKPVDTPDPGIIITWPGTDIPVGGTLDPKTNPEVFAPVIVSVLEAIEDAVDVVQKSGTFPTPFTGNPEKERESIIQQTFWMVNAAITGNDYTKEDFTKNAYDQFQQTTGKTVASLPEEQKEEINSGISDFWNTFQVTGIVAKVISAESPGIDTGSVPLPVMVRDDPLDEWKGYDEVDEDAATDQAGGQDDVADPEVVEEESPYKCACPDSIKFNLEVKRGDTVISQSDSYQAGKTESTLDLKVNVENLRFGDIIDVKISNIDIECECAQTSCDVKLEPFQYIDARSNNCEGIYEEGSDTERIKIEAENKKDISIFCTYMICATCTADGCEEIYCCWFVKIAFEKSKKK